MVFAGFHERTNHRDFRHALRQFAHPVVKALLFRGTAEKPDILEHSWYRHIRHANDCQNYLFHIRVTCQQGIAFFIQGMPRWFEFSDLPLGQRLEITLGNQRKHVFRQIHMQPPAVFVLRAQAGNTCPASALKPSSAISPLQATIHKSRPCNRRLPALVLNPAVCSAEVSVFSVKPHLCAM